MKLENQSRMDVVFHIILFLLIYLVNTWYEHIFLLNKMNSKIFIQIIYILIRIKVL